MAKGGSNKVSTISSGQTRVSRARRAARRIRMKIARWERYKKDGKVAWEPTNKKKVCPTTVSRYNNWDTTGLKKQLAHHEEIIAGGGKTKVA